MGLFGPSKKDVQAAEAFVTKSFEASKQLALSLHLFRSSLQKEELAWISKCQGYYDSCTRKVIIKPDLLMIQSFIYEYGYDENNNLCKRRKDAESIGFQYTDFKSVPLHSYQDANGYEVLNTQQVITLWAQVLRQHMQELLPDCTFTGVGYEGDTAFFKFNIPEPEWLDWF